VSLIVPRPTFLRILDALRWSRLAWSSLALGAAFGAGALCAGILAKPPADVAAVPIAMASVADAPRNFVPVRSRKTTATRLTRRLPEEAGARRETIGLAAIEPAVPPATAANLQAAAALVGEARAQVPTSAATSGQAPHIASDTEPSAEEPAAADGEVAKKAMREARRAKRVAKYSRWRMQRAQLDANNPQWADGWQNDRQLQSGREPSYFLFGRFDNRHM
jgi:hypothetical protein